MAEKSFRKIILKPVADDEGTRLDVFISGGLNISRSFAKKLVEDGCISAGKAQVKPSFKVVPGEPIEVRMPAPSECPISPENIPLDVLYEDSSIIVVNKPAGMVVHPAAGHRSGTLVNALLAHCKDLSGIGGELRAGIVHRLDIGTSGVMVSAKSDYAHRSLSEQFKARTVNKEYMALVVGKMKSDSGAFDAALGRSVRDRKKFSAKTKKARSALTEWKVLERFGSDATLVSIRLRTGRTHQIRVHFSEAGHPLIGDSTYGGSKIANRISISSARLLAEKLKRPALHALSLAFTHPLSGEVMKFSAKPPFDLYSLIKGLKKIYERPRVSAASGGKKR